jgi:hypothetical protein
MLHDQVKDIDIPSLEEDTDDEVSIIFYQLLLS